MTSTQTFHLEDDTQNRTRALELTSFIVEAPAGAGKTELLTQRYLKLLQTVSAPEEIIAITFTNKAAAEMRARILESLLKAAKLEAPSEAHKQITYALSLAALRHASALQWQLIENPSCLRIFTIDSLCAYLARQMPLMSRFGAQPRVAEDASVLYAQAAEQTLALLENTTHGEVVKTALQYVDNNAEQLKSLLMRMLEKRDQWLHHAQHAVDAQALQTTLSHLVTQAIAQAAEVVDTRIQLVLMPLARFAAANLSNEHPIALLKDWNVPLATTHEALPMWQALVQLLLTDKGEPRKAGGINVKLGFPATDEGRANKDALIQLIESMPDIGLLHTVRSLPALRDNQASWLMITALSKLLNLAVAELWLVFQRAGEVDFVEIAQRATQALADNLGDPTDLALKLDYKIQHLLVDEFQDTSPSQIALLKQLTLGWQAGDGRTLFAVGDPMQSIYRFRKANVGLFIEAAEHGIGQVALTRLQLYRNNRSCPPVVDWINHTFNTIFPSADDVMQGAIHYRPFIATKQDAADAGVVVHPIIRQADESAESTSLREAQAAIEIIRQVRANGGMVRYAHHERGGVETVRPSHLSSQFTGLENWGRPLRSELVEGQKTQSNKKIAVLVRSKKHLASLVRELRRHHQDIAFQAVEIEALEGRQAVQDLLSLTHALHHRADRVHWLAILRAPWCGLTLHDLHALAGHDHHSTIWALMQNGAVVSQLSADGQARLKHIRAILHEALLSQGRMRVSRWVRGVWLMLNGTACLWEQADVIDVQAFFTCLDQLDRSQQFSPERLQTEITKLFAAPDSHGEQVQMMTIHKSKGLEFDTVILLGLGERTGGNNSDQPLVLWEEVLIEDEPALLAAPFIPKPAREADTVSPYDYLAARETVRDANESARVLYVAATRAERQLHLIGVANQNAKGEIKPIANTYLDLLWPTVGAVYENAQFEAPPANNDAEIATFIPSLVRLETLAIPAVLGLENTMHSSKPNAKPVAQLGTSIEADIGTLTHRYLELIAKQGLAAWSAERIAALQPAMLHWLHQQGHAVATAQQAAVTTQRLLQTTLQSADGQWVLKPRADAQAEFAVTTLQHGEIKNYVVDRTFVENDTRWIIDYKTVTLADDITDAALQAIARQYSAQLDYYAQLFSHEGLPIQQAIYFVSIGKLVAIA